MKSDSESKDGISTLTVLSTNTYFALAKIGGALGADERVTKLNFPSRFFAVTHLSLVWHLSIVITIIVLAAIFSAAAFGQSQPTLTESEFWPEVDAHIQLPSATPVRNTYPETN